MWRAKRASCSSAYQLLRSYLHTSPRRRIPQVEPKSDKERARLGLPLREPWFETKPFDEKKKSFVLRLKDTLQAQPNKKMEIADLGQLRQELDVVRQGKQRKIATYVRRFPSAFTLRSFYTHNNKKKTWCSFSEDALNLLEEEALIFQASEAFLLQKLRKLLMISMKNRLPFATVNQVRESLGLPVDFKESLVNKYPDVFLLKERKGCLYLELRAWDDSLAISLLEKHAQEGYGSRMSKKHKKKRIKRLAAEGEGPEQETLSGKGHEQRFPSRKEDEQVNSVDEGEEHEEEALTAETHHKASFLLNEDNEHMISIDKRQAHEDKTLCRRGHEQSSSLKEEGEQVDSTGEADQERILSVVCETKGYKQSSRAVHDFETDEHEPKFLAVTDFLQHDTPFVSNLQLEPFQDEAPALVKAGQYLSDSALEKHQQETVTVSAVMSKKGHDEIQTLSYSRTKDYLQAMVTICEFGLENGPQDSTAFANNTSVAYQLKRSTVSDLDSEARIDNLSARSSSETEAYHQKNVVDSRSVSNDYCQEATSIDNITAEAHEHLALALSDPETDISRHEISAFSDLDRDDQDQAVSDLEGKDQCYKVVSGGIMVDELAGGGSQCFESVHGDSACLHFLWKNKKGKQPNSQHAAEIEAFQSAPYITPYRNSRDLELPLKSWATEKFVVAVLHEFLSLTLEKRATLQQLGLFQRPYRLPGNLLDFLLKYDGIFYVVQGRTKSHVFLKEAYKESMLIDKDPLVLWQQRFVELAFSTSKPEESKLKKGSFPQHAQNLCNEV